MQIPTVRRLPCIRRLCLPWVLAVLVLGASGFWATPARADAEDVALENITKLNRRAVDEYQNLNFDQARKLLREALDAASQAGLEGHAAAARTYVHLGVVVLAGFKQRDEAVKFFRKALDIQPEIKLDRSLATPEIQEVFDAAAAAASSKGGTESKSEAGADRTGGEGITHQPVTRAAQGRPILIKAEVAAAVGAKKVVLSYSADGSDDFVEKEMTEDPPGSGVFHAEIPGAATQGGVVDYFIEATGDEDKTMASKGSADHAMKIVLSGPAGEPSGVAAKKRKKETPEKTEGATWLVGLGLGSGIGYTTGEGDVNGPTKLSPAGFHPSTLGQVVPEVGYYLSPSMLLSAQLRLQYVTGTTAAYPGGTNCGDGICSGAWNAVSAFARATFLLGEGSFRPYVAGTLGGGQIRHVAKFDNVAPCGPGHDQVCVDTVAAGPVFVGGGGGFLYELSPGFDLNVQANALVGFSTFTFHVDLNAGLAYSF